MKVTVEPGGPCRQILQIDVPADEVRSEFENVTIEFMRSARIPGFRPGRAPRPMVERRFAKPIAEQVRERLVPKYYQQAIEQEKIEPVSVINLEPGTPDQDAGLSFKVIVDLAPDFELPPYNPIELTDTTRPVTDAEIDAGVLNLRRRRAQYPEVNRPSRDHDLVFLDYDATLDNKPLSETIGDCRELGVGRDVVMVIESEREIIPGFYAGLQGAAAGEERRIETTFPEDHVVEAVRNQTVAYNVRIKTVREEQLPELDADFFKHYKVQNEIELRSKLEDGLKHAATENESRRRLDAIMRYLLDNTAIETLPESLVEEENRSALQELVQDFVRQGVTREVISDNRDELMQMAERTSLERVKLNAILDRISNIEKIEADGEDFNAYVTSMAMRYRISPDKALKTIEQRRATDNILARIRRSKTAAFLSEHARVLPGAADTNPSQEESNPS